MLALLSLLAHASPPPAVAAALSAWNAAVDTEQPAAISALLPEDATLVIYQFRGAQPGQTLVLSRAELERRLADGEGNHLGLHRLLLSPRLEDTTRRDDGRYAATDERCPEVTWVFEAAEAQWRLVEIERRFYGC